MRTAVPCRPRWLALLPVLAVLLAGCVGGETGWKANWSTNSGIPT